MRTPGLIPYSLFITKIKRCNLKEGFQLAGSLRVNPTNAAKGASQIKTGGSLTRLHPHRLTRIACRFVHRNRNLIRVERTQPLAVSLTATHPEVGSLLVVVTHSSRKEVTPLSIRPLTNLFNGKQRQTFPP